MGIGCANFPRTVYQNRSTGKNLDFAFNTKIYLKKWQDERMCKFSREKRSKTKSMTNPNI